MIPYSVLDLAPIVEGGDAAQSFRCTLELARSAERWGYRRFWLAEHHGMPGIARTAADELIFASQVFDQAARLHSYQIAAQVMQRLGRPGT